MANATKLRNLRHWYNRRPVWLAGLILVGVVGAAALVAVLASPLVAPAQVPIGPSTPAPTLAPAPLTAHGVVQPVLRARVGTQGGGVVRILTVAAGVQVAEQQQLAVVQGPSGAEILTAPFAGTVTDVAVHLGDSVGPGAVIASVADLTAYQIETTDVDQFLVAHLRPGQKVTTVIDADNARVVTGTVQTVAVEPQAAGSAPKTYAVTISLSGPATDLRPGMTARLRFDR